MTTSATQPGVQTETTATTTDPATTDASAQTTTATDATTTAATTANTEPVLSARESVMEQITRQNDERMAAEHAAEGLAAPNAAVTAALVDDQVNVQLEDKPTVLESGLDKVMVRRKIDGVESEVSVAELLRDHQKHGAADKRLDEAARLLREAQAQAAAVKANPPVGVDPNAPAKDITTQPQPDGEDPKAVAKKIVTALFEGDEATALEVVEKLVVGRQAPTQPDTRQLVDQTTLAVKQQLSADSALEKFEKDYPDIMADPHLEAMTAGFIQAEMEGGKPFVDALAPAAQKTRDWLATKTGTPVTTTTPTIDRTQKLERKAGIDNVQALNTIATTVEEPVQSHSDVIADMKKSRGLA